MSDSDIFAGLSADISEGADGVLTIPSGECGRVQTDGSRELYLLGTGNALVVAQNYADCPFKVGGKGGEIPDLSLYAKKTDIPTELPANGGNADTAENINGVIIFKSLNIGVAEVGSAVKRVCNVDTAPESTGFVYAGIWFKNTLDTDVTAAVAVYATAKSPIIQAGYGAGSFQEMFGNGIKREWYSNETLGTSASVVKMTVPAGKTGYFGFNTTSADAYAVIEDAAVFTDKFI